MSTILALDQSTVVGSAAVMNDRVVLAARSWTDSRERNQQFFTLLPELLDEASVAAGGIDLFAVGLGPGAFAGLRMSLSAVRAWALPDNKPVYGVSSGEAIAVDVSAQTGASDITVVGDARRGRVWYARFAVEDGLPRIEVPYSLTPLADLPSEIAGNSVVVTPHWQRIGADLAARAPGATFVREDCLPRAQTVGRLVLDRIARRRPSDELQPIYMHPPVFVEPRFPAVSHS